VGHVGGECPTRKPNLPPKKANGKQEWRKKVATTMHINIENKFSL